MIWATVSSWSCFCWLYTAPQSVVAKNIINLILVLSIWWCPFRVISCVVGKECLLWPVLSLGKFLLDFALFHFVLQGQAFLYFRYLLTPCISRLLIRSRVGVNYESVFVTRSTVVCKKPHFEKQLGWRFLKCEVREMKGSEGRPQGYGET